MTELQASSCNEILMRKTRSPLAACQPEAA